VPIEEIVADLFAAGSAGAADRGATAGRAS
jgi:hypothetical protein